MTNAASRLVAENITAGYGRTPVLSDLAVEVPTESLTMIIGPNGCGKSTLLNALARVLRPTAGRVLLDGQDISGQSAKALAREVSLLPQSAAIPAGVQAHALVARGRYPYQRLFQQWSDDDAAAVRDAMEATATTAIAEEYVDQLSGGQRQRVWLAMLLAQQTDLMLLDEPTSYLDIAHQYELLDLLSRLRAGGKTIVTVLHDLNQAARYATHLIVMRDGAVVTTGAPADVITPELVRDVFDLDAVVAPDPVTGTPCVYPRTAPSAP